VGSGSSERVEKQKKRYVLFHLDEVGRHSRRVILEEAFLCAYYNAVIELAFSNSSSLVVRPTKQESRHILIGNGMQAIAELEKNCPEYYWKHHDNYETLQQHLKLLEMICH